MDPTYSPAPCGQSLPARGLLLTSKAQPHWLAPSRGYLGLSRSSSPISAKGGSAPLTHHHHPHPVQLGFGADEMHESPPGHSAPVTSAGRTSREAGILRAQPPDHQALSWGALVLTFETLGTADLFKSLWRYSTG